MKKTIYLFPALAGVAISLVFIARSHASIQGNHVMNTPHNLSVSGGGGAHDVKASDEVRICVFCHTPHHANSDGPLWSRDSNISTYVPYASTTIKANPSQPMGPSRLCLSCHDGTVAMGQIVSKYPLSSLGAMPSDTDPHKNANFGLDISNSHPISMTYGLNPEFNSKSALDPSVKLSEGTYVECTSCHDPHNNQYGNFLVKDTSVQHDALCTVCHNKEGWSSGDATHRTGGTRYTVEVSSPVAADGCVSCHRPHNAERPTQLLKKTSVAAGEETNCTANCHTGNNYSLPGNPDIVTQFAKPYTHPVQSYQGIHVEDEPLPLPNDKSWEHVQCVDCHNPHEAGWSGAPLTTNSTPPAISGPLRGVRGVAVTGLAITANNGYASYEYEICFRCHASSSFKGSSTQRPVRVFSTYDQSLRFAPGNPSYHPVTTQTVSGTNGRSLLPQYQNGNMPMIYCSSCHAKHGSDYPHILVAQNTDVFPSGGASFTLCFTCHSDQYLLNPSALPVSSSVNLHQSHVTNHQVPCASCHDPHGTPSSLGATTNNSAHLMNFDTNYAGTTASYNAGARSCTVAGVCHTTAALQQPQTY